MVTISVCSNIKRSTALISVCQIKFHLKHHQARAKGCIWSLDWLDWNSGWLSLLDWNIVEWDMKHQHKWAKKNLLPCHLCWNITYGCYQLLVTYPERIEAWIMIYPFLFLYLLEHGTQVLSSLMVRRWRWPWCGLVNDGIVIVTCNYALYKFFEYSWVLAEKCRTILTSHFLYRYQYHSQFLLIHWQLYLS